MKRYVYAMATDKKSVVSQISSVSEPVIEHLIKLYLFKDSEYQNHWRKEIWSFLHSVPKLKNTKKNPQVDLIRRALATYEDSVLELRRVVEDEYSSLFVSRSDNTELERLICAYLDWASEILSELGSITLSEVYSKLEELTL